MSPEARGLDGGKQTRGIMNRQERNEERAILLGIKLLVLIGDDDDYMTQCARNYVQTKPYADRVEAVRHKYHPNARIGTKVLEAEEVTRLEREDGTAGTHVVYSVPHTDQVYRSPEPGEYPDDEIVISPEEFEHVYTYV